MSIDPKSLSLYLPFAEPHPTQKIVLACKSKTIVVCCGRGWGKNALGSWWNVRQAYGRFNKDGSLSPTRGWFVAPSFNVVKEMEMQYLPIYRDVIQNKKRNSDLTKDLIRDDHFYKLLGESIIEFRSAEMTGNVGSRLDYILCDEASLISDYIYYDKLRPTLLGRDGYTLLISTPDPQNPKNWFYREYLRGLEKMDDEISSFHFTSYDNPHISREQLAAFKDTLTPSAFQMQIMAEFPDDDFGVFRNVKKSVMDGGYNDGYSIVRGVDFYKCSKCTFEWGKIHKGKKCPVCGTYNEPSDGSFEGKPLYFLGFDPARAVDFSVIKVVEYLSNRPYLREVYSDRFNDQSYEAMKNRVFNVYEMFPDAIGLMDSTGAGDPLLEDIQGRVNMQGFHFNGHTKNNLVENLINLFDGDKIRILPDSSTENELGAFTVSKTATGLKRYCAPVGHHDDCVIALALACFNAPRPISQFEKNTFNRGNENDFAWQKS